MESEWVRIMPFIEQPVPLTAVSLNFPGVNESKEVYDYFLALNPKSPIEEFKAFYAGLPTTPKLGQSKKEQIMEAVRLRKLADSVKKQMEDIGVKW